ncbi:MAG: WG repeat-containing protein [Bacteroidaceae bacterium]|nr:WG repeat-containing protein [Bacteroidaceae bacterium]
MEKSNKGRIIKVSVLILVSTVLLTIAVFAIRNRLYRSFDNDRESDILKGDNLSARIGRYGQITIIDENTGKAVLKDVKFDWTATPDNDSLAVFCYNDKRGYFNSFTGKVAIQPQYRRAWFFSCGLAGVQKDGMIGFIDHQGNTIIDFKFPYYGNPLSEFVFHDGVCVVADETGQCGVIDTLGNWLIQPEYKNVSAYKDFAIVKNPGSHIQVDYNGNIIDSLLVDYVYNLKYWSCERYVTKDGEVKVMNEEVESGMYAYFVGGLCGLMDAEGHRITPPVYIRIEAESTNLFTASLHDRNSQVILNRNGRVIR